MKIAFNKPGGPASLAETPTAEVVADVPADAKPVGSTAVATVPPAPVAAPSPTAFRDDDNIDPRDLTLPRLNLVQKVGELSNQFAPGAIVLDGQLVLADAPVKDKEQKPVRIVVIGFQATKFVEKVEGGSRGNVFNTEQEVVDFRGTLDYNESKRTGKPWYQRSATALVLIEKPEGDNSDYFNTPIDGKQYALALWTMKGTAYTNGARPIMTERKIGRLRTTGYRGGFLKVNSKLQKFGENYAYIPVVKVSELSSDAFRAALLELGL